MPTPRDTLPVIAYIDGGARGNPGPAAYAVVILSEDGTRLRALSKRLGHATNNFAEYQALLAALEYALDHGHVRLKVVSDSELLVRQVQGRYKVKSPDLQPLHQQARRMISRFETFSIEHVRREQNREADRLVNEALDAGEENQFHHQDTKTQSKEAQENQSHHQDTKTHGKEARDEQQFQHPGSEARGPAEIRNSQASPHEGTNTEEQDGEDPPAWRASPRHEPIPQEVDRTAAAVVDAAYAVHSGLGPGLLENVYQACLAYELEKRGLAVEQQVSVPVVYDGLQLNTGLRLDLLVERCVIAELKAVETLLPIHTAQLLTYLKLTGHRLGLLINFNVPLIRDGIKRVAR
ncbi:MAG TPA: GxxExxY protein [Terriglobia bacterium]|nr:GxxExxY protein [Terriglobia bacterium]